MKTHSFTRVLTLLLGITFSGPILASTYRLELRSGNVLLAEKVFEFSKGAQAIGYSHPSTAGSSMNGVALEIGDSVAACGTFLKNSTKYTPERGSFASVGAVVTLVEKSSIGRAKINAETNGTDQIDEANKVVSVRSQQLARVCSLRVIK